MYQLEMSNPITLISTLENMRLNLCVYAHYIGNDVTNPFFIGMTKLSEVFQHRDAFRNHKWLNTVKQDTVLTTKVLWTGRDIKECRNHLGNFVSQHRPVCNLSGFLITGHNAITCVVGPNAGTTYSTTTEAAQRNGISQPALSNHLNGRQGYEVIRGMKFQRGLGK